MEKYGKKGTKFVLEGRITTGSYEKDGRKVYTTEIMVDSIEFAESKSNNQGSSSEESKPVHVDENGFMNVDETQEELPFR